MAATPILSRVEFLRLLGISSPMFDQMAFAGYVPLAFGSPVPAVADRYLALDCVYVTLATELTPTLGRRTATDIVLTFSDHVLDAVGRAEAGDETLFAVFAVGNRGEKPTSFLVTSGTRDEIASDYEKEGKPAPARYIPVDIPYLLQYVRARATQEGLDLSAKFFLPPSHPDYARAIEDARNDRKARLERLRREKRFAKRAKAFNESIQRKDIKGFEAAAKRLGGKLS